MTARDTILATLRSALAPTGDDTARARRVAERLARRPRGPLPERAAGDLATRAAVFCDLARASGATLDTLATPDDVPAAIAALLRARNLPLRVRHGADPRLAALPWRREPALEIALGASDGTDTAGVTHALAAIAESGTVVVTSGPDNPTTLNFLPELHVVIVDAADIVRDYETVWERLRAKGPLPRMVNWITGPSRSADIDQTLILGAHGPRQLHILVVGLPGST